MCICDKDASAYCAMKAYASSTLSATQHDLSSTKSGDIREIDIPKEPPVVPDEYPCQ
jgi:hypothetical protein